MTSSSGVLSLGTEWRARAFPSTSLSSADSAPKVNLQSTPVLWMMYSRCWRVTDGMLFSKAQHLHEIAPPHFDTSALKVDIIRIAWGAAHASRLPVESADGSATELTR
ncbi:hypothetical protein FOXG_18163 [Fusarium oxysporum f. sp. lycopersici 4287]|uniref:Uncharacterized protein n=2 Tax=Fusarium oxysporum TaxID=5507 RepID=A0A0J9WHC7_FUSO4|nr:hypothetical protein FOXG_18163 [Fusarium oxysporum f. sp. lycopersici 4287]EXK42474.1 hypothetical protein FOMG_05424 [Fusarium oxysporum f. sp. melonis 26406]KNA96551.1 hypothetical protein FOXG_18163 [Fusarium oxysporum f. sp. lycopersici 4287]